MASKKDTLTPCVMVNAPVAEDLGTGYEGLWAMPVGRGRYRLENVPFFTTGLSAGDIVFAEAEAPGGRPIVTGVSIHGGHSTFLMRVGAKTDAATFDEHWQRLAAIGCTRERGMESVYAVDVPPGTDIAAVRKIMRAGRRARVWIFDEIANGHFA